MSRELMSLPIVQPTICAARVEHERKLRLGHAPRRIAANPDRLAGRHDLLRQRLEENLGAIGVVHPVVRRRAEVGLLHARGLAAQVGHAGGPDFLPLDRRAERSRPRRRTAGASCDRSRSAAPTGSALSSTCDSVVMPAGVRSTTVRVVIDQPNPHGGVTGEKAANLHGGHASDCTTIGSRTGAAIVTGFRSARPKPAN